MSVRVGIVGDRDPEKVSHRATHDAVAHAGGDPLWLATDRSHGLASIDALWLSSSSDRPHPLIQPLVDAG